MTHPFSEDQNRLAHLTRSELLRELTIRTDLTFLEALLVTHLQADEDEINALEAEAEKMQQELIQAIDMATAT